MIGNLYAYCRVSTKDQKLERQEKNIKEYYKERLEDLIFFEEKFTGTTSDRPEWKKLIKIAREGDTIIFDSVSRMSRDGEEGYNDYLTLWKRKINLIFLNEQYLNTEIFNSQIEIYDRIKNIEIDDTFSPLIKGIVETLKNILRKQIKVAFEQAEKERDDIVKRITEGQKLTIRKMGRPKRKIPEVLKNEIIDGYINSRKKDIKYFINNYKISRKTFYNYIDEIKKEV
ncbi:recombinase family protein [Fusobacterium ulcerans]|uniref:recombinase family protein n=1 Tax=Fusobacterium ulcerans TaxID=861 RepID=UPI000E537973|nr:recombinase family protein [Fusobacterium ulcerans]RGY64539.1 recombinase family protein [Fusobacterium ulcerans]